jgi:hypothetical protein
MPAARVLLLAAITVLSIGAAASPPAPQPVPQTHGARETPDATGDRGPGKQRLPATGASQTPAPDAIGSKSGSQGRADDPTADGWMRKATFWSAIANIAIALVALIGLGLTRQAANAATKSADASVRSVDIARQALVDVQRAYMFVKSFQVDHIQEQGRVAKWRIVTQWENYGQTPAVDVRMASVPPKIPSEQTQELGRQTAPLPISRIPQIQQPQLESRAQVQRGGAAHPAPSVRDVAVRGGHAAGDHRARLGPVKGPETIQALTELVKAAVGK